MEVKNIRFGLFHILFILPSENSSFGPRQGAEQLFFQKWPHLNSSAMPPRQRLAKDKSGQCFAKLYLTLCWFVQLSGKSQHGLEKLLKQRENDFQQINCEEQFSVQLCLRQSPQLGLDVVFTCLPAFLRTYFPNCFSCHNLSNGVSWQKERGNQILSRL